MSLEQVKRLFLDVDEAKRKTIGKSGQDNVAHVAATPARPRKKKTVQCFECGKTGHKRRHCYQLKEKQNPGRREPPTAVANVALMASMKQAQPTFGPLFRPRDDPKEYELNRQTRNLHLKDMPVKFPCVLDSGASQHMIRDVAAFNKLWDIDDIEITTAENGERMICKRAYV